MTKEKELIEKLKEYIKKDDYILGKWETSNIAFNKIRSEIAQLEQEIKASEITDADIEAMAEDYASYEGEGNEHYVDAKECDGFIAGAKAMRDGEIKHIKK